MSVTHPTISIFHNHVLIQWCGSRSVDGHGHALTSIGHDHATKRVGATIWSFSRLWTTDGSKRRIPRSVHLQQCESEPSHPVTLIDPELTAFPHPNEQLLFDVNCSVCSSLLGLEANGQGVLKNWLYRSRGGTSLAPVDALAVGAPLHFAAKKSEHALAQIKSQYTQISEPLCSNGLAH